MHTTLREYCVAALSTQPYEIHAQTKNSTRELLSS